MTKFQMTQSMRRPALRTKRAWHIGVAGAALVLAGGAIAETIQFPSVPLSLGACMSAGTVSTMSAASTVSSSSGTLNADTQIFQGRFDSSDWSGELLAYSLAAATASPCASTPIGAPCNTPNWDAGQILNSQSFDSGRNVITYDASSRKGIPFRWDNLNAEQQALLNANPDAPSKADNNGALRVEYLRGSTEHESPTATPRFRRRIDPNKKDASGSPAISTVLGDIIDSNPFYVGAPSAHYGFNDYEGFRAGYASRTPMVYVGANDGMLHGFNASARTQDGGGKELLAYVPSPVFGVSTAATAVPQLSLLTSPSYRHTFMVDGGVSASDACWGGNRASCWHTVLAGGLGAGGHGVYALDVTDPARFKENNADSLLLWEFTSRDNADLGYTFSQPAIVRMANDRWAIVVGNGYDNTGASGRAALFILFIDHDKTQSWDGDYVEIPVETPSGFAAPNGLATPAAVDTDGDGYIDAIYAGDLAGDLWKFDVRADTPSQWKVAYGGKPLFVATDSAGNRQSITERPNVGYNLLTSPQTLPHDVIVYFGTGRYLDATDNTIGGTNTFYGIFDEDWSELPSIARSNLLKQTVTQESVRNGGVCSSGSDCFRLTSSNTYNAGLQGQYGWYIDLTDPGERQVTNPTLYGGKIIFTTLIPASGICSADATGWLMELAASNGGAVDQPTLDINHDNAIDSQDDITVNGKAAAPSGTRSTAGILSSPQIEISPRTADGNTLVDHLLISTSAEDTDGNPGAPLIGSRAERSGATLGRISWHEITPP